MGNDSESRQRADFYHQRADHEDTLFVARTNVFLVFNGFLAVAVGIVTDRPVKIVFVSLVLIVDLLWTRWAPNSKKFIRALRDSGREREDERLWRDTVGGETGSTLRAWTTSPLTIISVFIPTVLVLGWILILTHLIWKVMTL